MKFKNKTALLIEKDLVRNSRFNGRIVQAITYTFMIEDVITTSLKEGDTFEIARLTPNSKLVGIGLENSFKDVEYTVGISSRDDDSLVTLTNDNMVSTMLPLMSAESASVYITIKSGTVKAGDYIKGAIMYVGI